AKPPAASSATSPATSTDSSNTRQRRLDKHRSIPTRPAASGTRARVNLVVVEETSQGAEPAPHIRYGQAVAGAEEANTAPRVEHQPRIGVLTPFTPCRSQPTRPAGARTASGSTRSCPARADRSPPAPAPAAAAPLQAPRQAGAGSAPPAPESRASPNTRAAI